MTVPSLPSLDDIRLARARLAPFVTRTPLVEVDIGAPGQRLFLKLETLQPVGAFKIRPALNAVLSHDPATLKSGVATVSSGNMAYALAWAAKSVGISMAAYMFANAPRTKIEGVQRLGGEVRIVSDQLWWRYIMQEEALPGAETMIHPVTARGVLEGNGTIGLEIIEDLPEVDHVLAPYGGGALLTGIAAAVKATRPGARMLAVESENATPVAAALAAGGPVNVAAGPSFIKSIGGPTVIPAFWPVARSVLDGSITVRLQDVVASMGLLFRHAKVVAEGAGAAALAAALAHPELRGNIVCIVSGGNIDASDYCQALSGQIPSP